MENEMENREVAIRLSGVKKRYKLGQIGGGTLQGDLQSWWARVRGKEDPNTKIGTDQRLVGQTFMALNGIDFTVYKGEALGIIGGNGAGKSTMLKLLSRVTAPTEGEIDIYGRITSMLEVGTGFNGEMTGRENVYMNGAILGMTKAEIDAKMEDIIEFSEVREFIDTPVKRYSSGMYVKLAFSVAAHLDSEIMIMDEVLAVGDMAFQKKCLDKMRDAAQKEGRTVLYVSHNMNTIRQLCDRCIVLDQGKIVFSGDVEEAISRYLKNNASPMGTKIDLSQSRMAHLSPQVQAKITYLTLQGKQEPVYSFNERIPFEIQVLSHKRIEAPCIRLEIRSSEEVSVGALYMHNLKCIKPEQINRYSFVLENLRLAPGRYKALIVLYEVNQFGSYNDLDAVWPGFIFDVVDSDNSIPIIWNNRHWGNVVFECI
ncbi:polysaccharide ABC transporter ATP-binding protein [Blautia obeum]|uniref:ABC transporter ATP-binding protein n=1 Tax=Blautia obeum TaxID=40520 RepID=UPI003CFC1664